VGKIGIVRRIFEHSMNETTHSLVRNIGNFRQVRRRAVRGMEILIPDRSEKIIDPD
jgi:hypothetical protein